MQRSARPEGGAFRGPAGRRCCALSFLRPNRGLAAAPLSALPATKTCKLDRRGTVPGRRGYGTGNTLRSILGPGHPFTSHAQYNAPPIGLSHQCTPLRINFVAFVIFCKKLSVSSPFPPVQIPVYSSSRLAISSIERPVISGSSLSTVASMISRFLFCRSKIFSSTVPRVISL
jgi:hypothetical protein